MLNIKEAFGLRLKELRKERGLTQEKLAEMVDLTSRQLSRVESGENFISAEALAKISIALQVELSSLFNFSWDEYITLLSNGTDSNPCVKIIQKDGVIDIKPYLKSQFNGIKIPKHLRIEDSEDSMLDMAKSSEKPITVQYFYEGIRTSIKTYFPSGEVKTLLSENQIALKKLEDDISQGIKKISGDKQKLEYALLSLQSIDSSEALSELKILLKGIELAQNSK